MSKIQKILVKEIYSAREGKNQDFSTLLLQAEVLRSGTQGAITNMFLSADKNSSIEKRTAFQPISNAKIEALGIKVGDDVCKKLGIPMRLTVHELTTAELLALPTEDRQSFQIKRNNGEDRLILVDEDDQPVWRKVSATPIDATDKYVQHVDMVDEDAFDQDELRNAEQVVNEEAEVEEVAAEASPDITA